MESVPISDVRPLILLVEDDAGVRQLVLKALSRGDYEVVARETVAAAQADLVARAFDLLIVDKNLPDGSGLEVVEQVRKRADITEVIVITGYSDIDSAIRAVDLGVFRYLKKPFDLSAFDIDVRRALESTQLRRELSARARDIENRNAQLLEALGRARESDARRIQAERMATLGYIAAGVAHELNNPLAVLSMTIPPALGSITELVTDLDRAVADGRESAEVLPGLTRIAQLMAPTRDAIELLLSLARDLHTLGRTTPAQPRPVALAAVVASALRLSHHQIKYKARTEIDIPPDLVVLGRENRLIQVFINLLTNAARAIAGGDLERNRVSIRGRREGAEAVVEVTDTGRGILPQNLERIFTRFFTQSGPGESGGSGLGLTIVNEVLAEHGGTIEVRSRIGAGTTFTLRLPLTADRSDSRG
ncbi:MAG TPA: ATP-binding protein [Polyangia bacterium]|nr:ATP-binding protein [Polyangia bacterium]